MAADATIVRSAGARTPSWDGPAVVTEGLERRFGTNDAVAGVDLAVQTGEMYGFLGPNGAGKSTMVRMLCTLLAPTGGKARVAGFDVATQAEEVRLRIGVALQDAALDPIQTGTELLRLQARLYGLSKAQADQRIDELRDVADLGDALDDRIATYSGGMKRRLDLAAALVHNPDVLFLDEPTTGLDPVSRVTVWNEVRRLNEDLGMTIFLTTQYLEEADELAHRVEGDLEAARKAVAGLDGVEAAEIHGDELTISVAEGSSSISPVAIALDGCEVRVRELTLRTPTLDDVFLELTGNRIQSDADGADAEVKR
jgi:ABC-2 type transport system ATP-binding protein